MLFRQLQLVVLLNAAVGASADERKYSPIDNNAGRPDFERLQRYTDSITKELATQPSSLQHRNLADANDLSPTCELKFLGCLTHKKCVSCFTDMGDEDIDWSLVASDTSCGDLLDTVADKFKKCTDLKGDDVERTTFCETFEACSLTVEGDDEWNEPGSEDDVIDCDKLEKCEFEGFKPNYLGDGICHEHLGGCYNHAICNYDNGDCCEDTCESTSEYIQCGTDGYTCRDPKSKKCDMCKDKEGESDGSKPEPKQQCKDGETAYYMRQYSTFGDGWEPTTKITVNEKDYSNNIIYNNLLHTGYTGKHTICLSNEAKCYHVELSGGSWGNDISWAVKPTAKGARDIASGGSPMNCNFPVAGGDCENTCTGGVANSEISKDKTFESYSDLQKCVQDKCVIQEFTCKKDSSCSPCMVDSPPAYCSANDNYAALVFCSQCNCVSGSDVEQRKDFCASKSKEKSTDNDENESDKKDDSSSVTECDWDQRKQGMDAIQTYSKCARIQDKSMLELFEFDNDNFGLLDKFEECATEYLNNKATKSALNCMEILQDAIDNPSGAIDKNSKNNGKELPTDAISSLARDLLHRGHDFCDCSKDSMKACPACNEFVRFKTLLYESLDACDSLDKIDCGAWEEFAVPCKRNMVEKFGSINFQQKTQCTYIHDEQCGNVGSFPGFRELDCSGQITDETWDFYKDYQGKCLKDSKPSKPSPTTAPKSQPVPKPAPQPKPYIPSSDDNSVGSDDAYYTIPEKTSSTPKKYVSPDEKVVRHHFRNFVIVCIVGGAAYFVYKKRSGFDYSQFRMSRARNFTPYGNDDSMSMYNSVPMMDQGHTAGSSFQPPSLPPHPNAYGMPHNGGVA